MNRDSGLLDRPVQYLKGVGPRRAEQLERLGIRSARDLLYHAPHRYVDATSVTPIARLNPGMDASAVGRVVSKGVIPTRSRLRVFQAVIRDESGLIECAWPGQPFLDRTIRKGDKLLVSGPIRFFRGRQMQPREFTVLARAGEDTDESGAIFPVYPATAGLSHRQLRNIIDTNLDRLLGAVDGGEEPLPSAVRNRVGLPDLRSALEWLHRPQSAERAERARRRLAFQELFMLQLLYARARHEQRDARPGIAFERRNTLVTPFATALPFQLTGAQKRVLAEIGDDMASGRPMNRLLQGDVGSGKTVVALFAMLRAIENGYQAALMAPTELLADQHHATIRDLLGDLPVDVVLLRGGLRSAERREELDRIRTGAASLIVGTHALIQEDVQFQRLGLAVIDEQHRFGVRQRMRLRQAATFPDVLVMSATPIPRSLALTLYGDLDVSVLDEMPPGRRPVTTALRRESARRAVLDFVREQVGAGRQAYIVYPVIEESEKLDVRSATDMYERLTADDLRGLRVGLVHGRMPGDEKDLTMRRFVEREIDVLVSTTVIEVGIDVPNATVMVIENGERFGLSQLHQLRGRVGRGGDQSYCIVLHGGKEPPERLEIFARTTDGFEIARADLHLRGYGDLFGAKQHGLPEFRFADPERDMELLVTAREEALRVIDSDAELDDPANAPAARALADRYGERLRMFDIG